MIVSFHCLFSLSFFTVFFHCLYCTVCFTPSIADRHFVSPWESCDFFLYIFYDGFELLSPSGLGSLVLQHDVLAEVGVCPAGEGDVERAVEAVGTTGIEVRERGGDLEQVNHPRVPERRKETKNGIMFL